jgi:cytochrome P450
MSQVRSDTHSTVAEGEIPVVDPAEITLFAKPGEDWRARYDALREQHPFFRVGPDPTVWFTRYDACREILSDGELFWAGAFQTPDAPKIMGWDKQPAWDRESAAEAVRRHIHVRKALMPRFTPSECDRWIPRMREIANDLIDRFAAAGEADFVNDFSRHFFPVLGMEILGAPLEDWGRLAEWQHEVFKVPPDISGAKLLDLQNPTMEAIVDYVEQLIESKRSSPGDDFIGHLLRAEKDGMLLPEEVRWAGTIFVLGSGHTVTAHLGYVFKYLAEHPDLRLQVIREPEKIDSIGEELLRLHALFGHTRTVTEDMEFHGCSLRKGDVVFVCYTMPCRDPRGPGQEELDFGRDSTRHLAWNFAWKQCIGIHFARRARRVALEEWHARIPEYRIRDGVELVEQVYAGIGYHSLPFVWQT